MLVDAKGYIENKTKTNKIEDNDMHRAPLQKPQRKKRAKE